MKKIFVMTVMGTALLASCGTSQKTAAPDYQAAQQKTLQQQPTYAEQRPARTLRQMTESERLAIEDCDKWRALGTTTSYVEKVARNEAQRDARNQLAQMMKVAVESAAQDYEMNAQQNLKGSAESLGESVMSQFVAEEVKNSHAIHFDVFDLADGSVQVYVCMEIRGTKKDFEERLSNTLDREGIIGIQYDRDRFVQKMAAGLEEYKKKNQPQ